MEARSTNLYIEAMEAPFGHIEGIASGPHCASKQLRLPFPHIQRLSRRWRKGKGGRSRATPLPPRRHRHKVLSCGSGGGGGAVKVNVNDGNGVPLRTPTSGPMGEAARVATLSGRTGTVATSAWAPPATRRSLSGPTGGVLSCREAPSGCPTRQSRGSLAPSAGLAVAGPVIWRGPSFGGGGRTRRTTRKR
jgi:hypothetical protein